MRINKLQATGQSPVFLSPLFAALFDSRDSLMNSLFLWKFESILYAGGRGAAS